MSDDWISVAYELPDNLDVVLIRTSETNVFGRGGVLRNMHVAQFCRGNTSAENPKGPWGQDDQYGNNRCPYSWHGDGPCRWFGQDVTHWRRI